VNTYTQSIVFNIGERTAFETTSTKAPSGVKLHWLDKDGILLTISKAISPDTPNAYYWLIEGWDPQTGHNIPSLRATMNVKSEAENPPDIVSVGGRAFDGTLKFAILSEDGRFKEVMQVVRSKLVRSSNIILPTDQTSSQKPN
jgi:hypothetical protein